MKLCCGMKYLNMKKGDQDAIQKRVTRLVLSLILSKLFDSIDDMSGYGQDGLYSSAYHLSGFERQKIVGTCFFWSRTIASIVRNFMLFVIGSPMGSWTYVPNSNFKSSVDYISRRHSGYITNCWGSI